MRSSVEAWREECEALAAKVENGNDEALIDLVRRDPRYLGSPRLQAKVLDCKLSIAAASKRVPAHVSAIGDRQSRLKGAEARAMARAGEARKWLAQLAQAIEYVTGRGNGLWTDLAQIKREYDFIVDRLTAARRMIGTATAAAIAAELELPEARVDELMRRPQRLRGLAEEIVMADFGCSRDNFRRLIRKARDAGW